MKDLEFLKSNLIAHRGIFDNKKIYENTTNSYLRAIKHKYIIQLDVRMLKDNTLVCFHDDSLDRMLHVDEKIEKLTYDELSYMSKYKIPTLEEALEIINGKVPIILDLKSVSKKYTFEKKVANVLDKYEGLFAIESFNIRTIKWFYKHRKNYIIGILLCKKNYKIDYFFRKYDFIVANVMIFNDKKIKKMREKHLVIGYKILNNHEYDVTKEIYDNLIIDNILEIDV